MFLCHVCKQQSLPGMPATRVVLERRVKVYPKDGAETVEGWEIVREVLAHGGCALTQAGKAVVEQSFEKLADIIPAYGFAGPPIVLENKVEAFVGLDGVLVEFIPPVPIEKIEEVFSKPKKQKRAKKAKVEEAN